MIEPCNEFHEPLLSFSEQTPCPELYSFLLPYHVMPCPIAY